MKYTELTISQYDQFKALLDSTDGVSHRSADGYEKIEAYLERNKGHSFAAFDGNELIGCALCGHDGRRGYLQHVMVKKEYREKGIGKKLVDLCLDTLENVGILKTHIDVFKTNDLANTYWRKREWIVRDDINRYSFNKSTNSNI